MRITLVAALSIIILGCASHARLGLSMLNYKEVLGVADPTFIKDYTTVRVTVKNIKPDEITEKTICDGINDNIVLKQMEKYHLMSNKVTCITSGVDTTGSVINIYVTRPEGSSLSNGRYTTLTYKNPSDDTEYSRKVFEYVIGAVGARDMTIGHLTNLEFFAHMPEKGTPERKVWSENVDRFCNDNDADFCGR